MDKRIHDLDLNHKIDLRPDLYVANDVDFNRLYRNLGGGAFEDVSLLSGAAFNREGKGEASMGRPLNGYRMAEELARGSAECSGRSVAIGQPPFRAPKLPWPLANDRSDAPRAPWPMARGRFRAPQVPWPLARGRFGAPQAPWPLAIFSRPFPQPRG
jgi:hypothetical protein